MRAWRVLLTHFSNRYPRLADVRAVPRAAAAAAARAVPAFDLMEVRPTYYIERSTSGALVGALYCNPLRSIYARSCCVPVLSAPHAPLTPPACTGALPPAAHAARDRARAHLPLRTRPQGVHACACACICMGVHWCACMCMGVHVHACMCMCMGACARCTCVWCACTWCACIWCAFTWCAHAHVPHLVTPRRPTQRKRRRCTSRRARVEAGEQG